MAQLKIYGHASFLRAHAEPISDALQRAAVAALGLPEQKRFHRFIPLEPWQLRAPADRGERYLIIEVILFAGRSDAARRAYLRAITSELADALGTLPGDVEVVLIESPRGNWSIRGKLGDELELPYTVEV